MNPLIDQLKDIDGLDPISIWPLAIGWWILIAIMSIFMILILLWIIKGFRFRRSWKYDTFKRLDFLEKKLTDETSKETLIVLSEYMRRIALKLYPRKECAGLKGVMWLQWLREHDPINFEWDKKGMILLNAPYAPLNATIPTKEIVDLIQAAKRWVVKK